MLVTLLSRKLIRLGICAGLALAALSCNGAPPFLEAVRKADALTAAKEYRKAALVYQKAIQQNPNEPAAYLNQAALFRKLGDYDKALANYRIVENLLPDTPYASFGRARVYFEQGLWDKAETAFKKTLGRAPPRRLSARSRLFLGRIAMTLKKPEAALALFDELLAEVPAETEAYYHRAKLYAEFFGRENDAFADYEKYIAAGGQFAEEAKALIRKKQEERRFNF